VLISYNGVLTRSDDKIFSSESRIYKYGDGYFESIKILNRQAFLFDKHYNRIHRAAALFKLPLKERWTQKYFEDQIELLSLKTGVVNGRCRMTFYRDAEGYYAPESNRCGFLIEMTEGPNRFYLNDKGLVLGSFQQLLKPSNFTSFFKSLSCITYVMAGIYAVEHNLNSVVLYNENLRVSEIHNANIFVIIEDDILTPALSEYCLDGVMRQYIIEKLKMAGKNIIETEITEEDLLSADEVFVSNASQGMQWVESYEGKNYSFAKTQEIFAEVLGI